MDKFTTDEKLLVAYILEKVLHNAEFGENCEDLTTDCSLLFAFDEETLGKTKSAWQKVNSEI